MYIIRKKEDFSHLFSHLCKYVKIDSYLFFIFMINYRHHRHHRHHGITLW